MRFYRERRAAMVTVELVVSLVLITVVLLLTLGLFSNNLKTLFTASNFSNVFKGGNTIYSLFHRDYSTPNSSVDIELLAEQGLGKIRQLANNSAIGIIDKAKDHGGENSTIDGNTLWYLQEIINAIVGDPTICTKLKFESNIKCEAITGVSSYALVSKRGNALSVTSAGQDSKFSVTISTAGNYNESSMNSLRAASVPAIKSYTDANIKYISADIATLIKNVADSVPTTTAGGGVYDTSDVTKQLQALIGGKTITNELNIDDCVLSSGNCSNYGLVEQTLAKNWVSKDRGEPCGCTNLKQREIAECSPAVSQKRIATCTGINVPRVINSWLTKDNFMKFQIAKNRYYSKNLDGSPYSYSSKEYTKKGNSIVILNHFTGKYEQLLLPMVNNDEEIPRVLRNYNAIYTLWYNDKINVASRKNRSGLYNVTNKDIYKYCNDSSGNLSTCMTYFIRQDQKFDSCKIFKRGLIGIAKKHGFNNLANDIDSDRQCNPYDGSSDDAKPLL